jgi:radical SAM superfamily enzyme YgiQ (UPF0313 family)
MRRRPGRADARTLLSRETPPAPRRAGRHLGLVFPGSYAEASSSLGVHFVIRAARSKPGCSVGRILALQDGARPETLEEGAPAASLPVLLVSTPWELMVGPLVQILRSAGIPLLAQDRGKHHPVVVAGGALALSNPDLLEPIADVVIRGDGEEAMSTLLGLVTGSADRDEFISALAALEGGGSGTWARCATQELPVHSAYVTPRSALPSMHLTEVMRGCPHGCAFCVMSRRRTGEGPRYVPADAVLGPLPAHIRRVGLVGPSVLEHPRIAQILEELVERGLEASISSARADRVDGGIARLLSSLGLRTLTVALDGASERIRRAIGKSVHERDVLDAARAARASGIGRLKLYCMLGFEEESDDDVQELVHTCLELASMTSLSVSLGPVVPKKSTPLAGMDFVDRSTYEARLRIIRRALGRRVRVDATAWREARTEAALALMTSGQARDLYCRMASGSVDLARTLRGLGII